jgi:hypothetical protein
VQWTVRMWIRYLVVNYGVGVSLVHALQMITSRGLLLNLHQTQSQSTSGRSTTTSAVPSDQLCLQINSAPARNPFVVFQVLHAHGRYQSAGVNIHSAYLRSSVRGVLTNLLFNHFQELPLSLCLLLQCPRHLLLRFKIRHDLCICTFVHYVTT